MDPDTQMGGAARRFPPTRHSAIEAVRSSDPVERKRAWDILVQAYWKPVYKYVRLKWRCSNEDAKDYTQAFFARAVEKEFFASFDARKGSFRNFIRVCLDGFVANELQSANRMKRGGQFDFVPLDFETAEGELRQLEIPDHFSLEDYFHQEWVRSVFALAIDRLRNECEAKHKSVHFRIFEKYDLAGERVTYQELAIENGISVSDVTNYLHATRGEFRRIVLGVLEELTSNSQEFQEDARFLLRGDRSR